MYLLAIKGKGTRFYYIGVSFDLGMVDSFADQPFNVQLISALKTEDQEQAQRIKHYLHHYFADSQANGDWFDLSPQQADKLETLLADPDNLLSEVTQSGSPQTLHLSSQLWERLDKFAERADSLGQGRNLGQSSFEAVLERIAGSPRLLSLIEQELNGPREVSPPKQYQEAVIVRPEDAKTETIVWLQVNSDKISVNFPEKNEDYKQIVKDFGLRWDGEAESRTLGQYAGDLVDRAAELGHKLLANGFSVVFPDESIQEMAIAGEYEAECKRWVLVRVEGKYQGWFVLKWQWPEDCYEAAKEVPGSRYDKPFVVVPPEQFNAVIDFAQMNKFRFSQGALALVVQAKAMLESALVVSVEQREDETYPLDLPDLDWEDDDLDDDISFDAPPDTAV